jgi:hypothetical protein
MSPRAVYKLFMAGRWYGHWAMTMKSSMYISVYFSSGVVAGPRVMDNG